jgi:predicted nucleic acid-binding protein
MKILIDTNVIICRVGKVEGFLTASAVTDIYYVVRKAVGREKTLEAIRTLCSVLDIADVGKADVLSAMELDTTDYEDALAAQCARRIKADCIVTRNPADFAASPVPVNEPADFLRQFD